MAKNLEVTLPTDREIRITRSFDAPRELVWDAHTKPALVRRWLLGPPGWEMPVCEIDLRVGGKYRDGWVDKGRGKTMGMGGVFTEVVNPELIGSNEKFDDDCAMGETVNTQVFTQKGGKTHMTRSSTHGGDPALAAQCLDHLKQYLTLLFSRQFAAT